MKDLRDEEELKLDEEIDDTPKLTTWIIILMVFNYINEKWKIFLIITSLVLLLVFPKEIGSALGRAFYGIIDGFNSEIISLKLSC